MSKISYKYAVSKTADYASGSMKNADSAKIRNTTPPTNVTETE